MHDERLGIAMENWADRFCANGIEPDELAEVAASIDSWDQWCQAWCALGERHEALARRALAEHRPQVAGEHLSRAATAYHFAKFLFVGDPDQMRAAHRRAVACLEEALPLLEPPGRRICVPFPGHDLVGILRLAEASGSRPVVVLIPGLDSTKEELRLVEESFLARGVGTFAVDGPGQGEVEYDLPVRPDWEVPGAALLDAVGAEPGVDASRLAVWGVSLGGYYAARVAAGDPRVRACVALSGPYDLGAAWDGLPSLTRAAFTARSHSCDEESARARAADFTLEGLAGAIDCPLLVVFGARDRLFPPHGAVRLAREASGKSELLLLEEGNHGCANVVAQHRPYAARWVAAQLA